MPRASTGPISALLALVIAVAGAPPVAAQERSVVAHSTSLSTREAGIAFELSDGTRRSITFRNGTVLADDAPMGSYEPGGVLDRAWRALLGDLAALEPTAALARVQNWQVSALSGADSAAVQALAQAVAQLTGQSLTVAARVETPVSPPTPPRPPRATRAVSAQPAPTDRAAGLDRVASHAASLLGVFVALALLGFGFTFFAPRQFEAVADTVWRSFWRSFLAGLFAQPLIAPVFGMMIVGLALTVVGILLIPFAVVAFVVALLLALVGGYVAVARAVGEIYLRRRVQRGQATAGTWIVLRYIVYGLVGLLAVWVPAVLLGWVPVAGTVLTLVAALLTWTVATAGFGATLLSRAGLRGTVVRRLDYALTDADYWRLPPREPRGHLRSAEPWR